MLETDCLEIMVPQSNVNDEHVRVTEWHYADGEEVEKGAIVAELETSKAAFDLEAERAGFLHYEAAVGEEIRVGELIATIGSRRERPDAWLHQVEVKEARSGRPAITAKARKLMAKHGLTEDAFGGLDRITAEDVIVLAAGDTGKPKWTAPILPAERVDISWRKAHEIQVLSAAAREVIPSVVTLPVDAVSMDRVVHAAGEKQGIGITRGEWVLFCVSRVLERYPVFNGYFAGDAMFLYKDRNIGYAINLGKGLKVPVIKNADKQDLKAVVSSVKDVALRYMRDELTPDDLSQPTFTITDLGATGVTHFVPVLPTGQSGILGVCATQFDSTHFNLVLTFDHRVADGMEAAEFLQQLRVSLE